MKINSKLVFLMKLSKAATIISRKLGGHGLGFGDLAVLYAISQAPKGKIRRTDLAEAVGLTASGVTRILLPLEKIGVVKREANQYDARVSYAMLTKSGKQLFEDSVKWVEQKCEDLMREYSETQLQQASKLLEIISR
jgi:DNA-binding MarR family transcriptional regulator